MYCMSILERFIIVVLQFLIDHHHGRFFLFRLHRFRRTMYIKSVTTYHFGIHTSTRRSVQIIQEEFPVSVGPIFQLQLNTGKMGPGTTGQD